MARIIQPKYLSYMLIAALIVLLMPSASAAAYTSAEHTAARTASSTRGVLYVPDDNSQAKNPFSKLIKESVKRWVPKRLQPSAFLDNLGRQTTSTGAAVSDDETGAGTGGWTGFNRAYKPSTNPNVTYNFGRLDYLTEFDSNGTRHNLYATETNTDVSIAPDPPGFLHKALANQYYATYSEGTWSAPANLTSITGHQDTDTLLFQLDSDGYLHFIYTKWTWGRDSSIPAGNFSAYIHKNENLYYRYRSPEGIWSNPKKLTNFSGAWSVGGAWFYVKNNRIYGSFLSTFNKQTNPSTGRSQEIFIDGIKEDWNQLKILKSWNYSDAPGQVVPFWSPISDVSELDGEVSVTFLTVSIGASVFSTKCSIFGVIRKPDGTWSSVEKIYTGAGNVLLIPDTTTHYDSTIDRFSILVNRIVLYPDAAHPPADNACLVRHDSSGWKAPLNLTRLPTKQDVQDLYWSIDAWGRWHVSFIAEHLQYIGTAWTSIGSALLDTYETPDGLSAVKTILPFQNGRWIGNFWASVDTSGGMHLIYETHHTSLYNGTNYSVYYTDDTQGNFSSPKKLSADSGQTIDGTFITTNPGGGTLVSWFEKKFNGALPKAGALYSRYLSGGHWTDRKNVTQISGGDIVHVDPASGSYYWVNEGDLGDQQCIFETAKYSGGTYSHFRKYYTESINGSWGTPQLISSSGISGFPAISPDLNGRMHALFYVEDPATTKAILYSAMQKLPTPPVCTYYFAEGTTREGFQEWLCLQNPGDDNASAAITYMLGTGETKLQNVTLPAHSRVTVDVNSFVGQGQDVSAVVQADGLIVAERPMYFNHEGWKGGHDAMGSQTTSRLWYFAEGTTRPGFQEYLTLQNPATKDTNVTLSYMLGNGTTQQQAVPVPAHTRVTVDVNAALGSDKDVSVKVESPDIAIVAERPMYFNYNGWIDGHIAVGSTALASRWYFAEGTTRAGFDTYVCMENPGPYAGKATITYILGDGTTKTSTHDLPATSRQTVKVNDVIGPDHDVSMVVDSTTLILAERPMYFNYHGILQGGHNVVGGRTPKNSWYFAEGTTRSVFDEWLCLQNPGSEDAAATIKYMQTDGQTQDQQVTVPAHTRVTVDVRAAIGSDKDVSVAIWSTRGIIAERPMYFTGGITNIWPGGTNVMGL